MSIAPPASLARCPLIEGAVFAWTYVGTVSEEPERRANGYLSRTYARGMRGTAGKLGIVGSVEDCRHMTEDYVQSGARHVVFFVIAESDEGHVDLIPARSASDHANGKD